MNCITSGACRMLWNDEVTEPILPTRGLRQGDPLSPYLFVLCMERLSHWIEDKVQAGRWRPIKVSRSGARISHLFFTDDILLFAEERMDQAQVIKERLGSFSKASS